MALAEENIIDSINVTELGTLEVRTATHILRDGEVISKTYHRHTLIPGSDLTNENPRVVAIANAVWTPEVVAAYQASQLANQEGVTP